MFTINLLGITFGSLFFGTFLRTFGDSCPRFIRGSFEYGKQAFSRLDDPQSKPIEVPKKWFRHFYTFAVCWGIFGIFLTFRNVMFQIPVPEYFVSFLEFLAGGEKREVYIDSTSVLVGIILMTAQVARRWYETHYVQIFSPKCKINVSVYIFGYLHYFSTITLILANAEGFVRGSTPSPFSLSNLSFLQYGSIFMFCLGWIQQYKSNLLLVNLRKDKETGKTTDKHLIPRGGFFELVSSAHMFFEVVIYVSLYGVMHNHPIFLLAMLWVLCNQITIAKLNHAWYQTNFKDYPKSRRAIIPYII